MSETLPPSDQMPEQESPAPSPEVGYLTEEVFNEIWDKHESYVYNLVRRILRDQAYIDDVMQDVALQLYSKGGSFRHESSWLTWLHRVTVNAVNGILRKKMRQEPLSNAVKAAVISEKDVPETLYHEEFRERIQQALYALPQKYSEVAILSEVEDYPNAAIAKELGIKLGAVKTRLHRARKMLANALSSFAPEHSLS